MAKTTKGNRCDYNNYKLPLHAFDLMFKSETLSMPFG